MRVLVLLLTLGCGLTFAQCTPQYDPLQRKLVCVTASSGTTYTAGMGLSLSGNQFLINNAVTMTIVSAQSGFNCVSASANSSTYTCPMYLGTFPATLSAYVNYMVIPWIPDVNGAGGATTLNVDTLGAKSIKESNGMTDPTSTDIVSGRLILLFFDGTVLRLPMMGNGSSVGTTASLQLGPICAENSNAGGSYNLWDFPAGGSTSYVGVAGSIACAVLFPHGGSALWTSRSVFIPADWAGGTTTITVMVVPNAAAGTGNWGVTAQFSCPSQGTAFGSLSFNAAATTGAVAISATQYGVQTATTGAITMTGCTAGGWARLQLNMDTTVSSLTTTTIDLMDVVLNYTRH